MDNNISSSVKKYILYSAAALTMIAATVFILYQQVSKNIINTNIATMNEVALHDSMAVESVINERWSLLEALGDDLRHERFTTTKEVLAELRQGRHFVNAKMLVLVDDKGTVYRSTGLIGDKDDAKIAQELGNQEKRIVKRYDYVSPNYVQFNQEYLLVGVKLKPFTVEGTTFTHLAALISVRDIEKNLSVQSYQGEGVGYVIDSNGYYVVNIYRSHNFMTRENFFDDIKGRSFSNYGSVEEIKAELAAAKAFVKYIYESDFINYSSGSIPCSKRVIEKYAKELTGLQRYINNADTAVRITADNPNWVEVRAAFYPQIKKLLTGESTPEEAAKLLDENCNAAIKRGYEESSLHK